MLKYIISYLFKKNDAQEIRFKLVNTYKNEEGTRIVEIKCIDVPKGIISLPILDLIKNHRQILAQCTLDDIMTITNLSTSDNDLCIETTKLQPFKFYSILSMLFMTLLIMANIASSKLISIFNITMSGGVVIFPFTYIIGDTITEIYGYKRARQLIWASIACFVICLVMMFIVIAIPPSIYWHNQKEYSLILSAVPRIILASLVSYAVGEFTNSYVLAKMKLRSLGQNSLWKRIVLSTIIGILLDTSIFILLAYMGIIPFNELLLLIIKQYILKTIIEFGFMPITLLIINLIKSKEYVDIIDINTNFTPFSFDVEYTEDNNIKKLGQGVFN